VLVQSEGTLSLKGKTMMKYKVGLILFLFLVLVACKEKDYSTNSRPTFCFDSFHSDCKDEDGFGKIIHTAGKGKIIVSSFNDTIRVAHLNAYYDICAQIKMDVEETKYGFDLFEKDEGDTCRSKCYSDVICFIYNLSAGTYLIKVFDTTGNSIDQGYVIVRPKEDEGPRG